MSAAPRHAVVILALPHSGASTLAAALAARGLALPLDAAPGDDSQSASVARLNTRLIESFGSTWDDPRPLAIADKSLAGSRTEVATMMAKRRAARAAIVLGTAFPADRSIVFADRQLPIVMPLWRRTLAEAGFVVRTVIIYRSPIAMAQLLHKADSIALDRAAFLWHGLILDMLESDPDARAIAYRDLAAALAAIVDRLLREWEIPATPAAESAAPPTQMHSSDGIRIETSHRISAQTAALWALLERWNDSDADTRQATLADLRARYDEAVTLTGASRAMAEREPGEMPPRVPPRLAPTAIAPPPRPAPPIIPGAGRLLVFHYHLFKNAGSSVDAMLRENFAERWAEQEFATNRRQSNVDAVTDFIAANPHLDALSSHTAFLPLPMVAGRAIFPIFFVRQPLLRLRSAYHFERRQQEDTAGARLARSHDFGGFVTALLAQPNNRQARNFQTFRLAFGTPGGPADEASRAAATLGTLPFVGLVEAYAESIDRLTNLLQPHLPGFHGIVAHKNVSDVQDARSPGDRLAAMREELGDAIFDRLWAANADDIALFERVRITYPAFA